LEGSIAFTDIAKCVEAALERTPGGNYTSLDEIYALDKEIRAFINELSI